MTCPNLFGLFFRKSKFFKQKKLFMLQSTFSSVYFAIKEKMKGKRKLSKIEQNFKSFKKRQFSHINILEHKENRSKNDNFLISI